MKSKLDASFSPGETAAVSGVLAIPFLIMAFANLFKWQWLDKMDHVIGQMAVDSRMGGRTDFFRVFTELGGVKFSVVFVIVIGLLLYFVSKKKELAVWYVFTAAVGAGVLNKTIKYIFRKPRPSFEHLVVQGGYSFPSGHAMGSTIMYGGLLVVLFYLVKSKGIRTLFALLFVGLILLIGISRIYLGVHYPSDIIGGYSLGSAWLYTSVDVFRHLKRSRGLSDYRFKQNTWR